MKRHVAADEQVDGVRWCWVRGMADPTATEWGSLQQMSRRVRAVGDVPAFDLDLDSAGVRRRWRSALDDLVCSSALLVDGQVDGETVLAVFGLDPGAQPVSRRQVWRLR